MAVRNTVQRSIIETELRRLANHPTAEEVFEAVHAQHPSISRATVFRMLGRLAEEGEVGRVRINNGADRFDHHAHAHYHVRCTRCGRVGDVAIPLLAGIDAQAEAASGWRIEGHTLQFDGVCPECQVAERGAPLARDGSAASAGHEAPAGQDEADGQGGDVGPCA